MDINVYIENERTKIDVKKEIEKRSCGDPPIDITKINKNALTKINPMYYSEMKALECFFEGVLNLSKVNREILHVLNNKKIEEISNFDRFVGEGAYGSVGLTTFLEKYKFVLKTLLTKKPSVQEKEDMLKEYLFGIAVINSFRMYCPNFCYTLGTFYCDNSSFASKNKIICDPNPSKKDQYICYEEIKGETLWDLLTSSKKKMSFNEIFNIIFQLMLALEIAQRKNNFCHYDTHFGNILIHDEKSDFEIVLDDRKYSFKNTHIATFIDYGLSSMSYGNMILNTKRVGEIDSRRNYPVQGFDLYNILSILDFALRITMDRKKDAEFFNDVMKVVYKDRDPYSGDRRHQGINQHNARIFHFNEIISVSPLIFIEYLVNNFKDMFEDSHIRISYRDVLYPISPRSVFDVYRDLTGIKITPDCNPIPESMLLITYFNLDIPIKKEFIENDKNIYIGGFKDLEDKIKPIPDSQPIYKLNMKDKTLVKNPLIKNYLEATNIFEEIQRYIDMIYLVRQTGTILIYREAVNKLLASKVYQYYIKYNVSVRNCRRWIKCLLDSLKV